MSSPWLDAPVLDLRAPPREPQLDVSLRVNVSDALTQTRGHPARNGGDCWRFGWHL